MEDKDIIRLYLNRNESAISETSEKYGSFCTAIAMNILNCFEDAEECVNDTYISTWNSIPPTIPEILSVFLGRITRNLSFNRYKYDRREKRGGGETAVILDELSELVSGRENTEDEVTKKELVGAIDDFLVSLSREKRNIFIRRYWFSDSISKISKVYSRSENSVSVMLNRIRRELREYLTERGYDI